MGFPGYHVCYLPILNVILDLLECKFITNYQVALNLLCPVDFDFPLGNKFYNKALNNSNANL